MFEYSYSNVCLKNILEDGRYQKISFDARVTVDALYYAMNITLTNMLDLQILEVAGTIQIVFFSFFC